MVGMREFTCDGRVYICCGFINDIMVTLYSLYIRYVTILWHSRV